MARPQVLQFLKHEKILCKKVFPFFIETYNWVVGAFDNLKGDFDTNPKNGLISVDKSNADRPVIRFRLDKLMSRLGASGVPGCFEIVNGNDGAKSMANTYYRIGGKTYSAASASSFPDNGILCLVVNASGTSPTAAYQTFADVTGMMAAEGDMTQYICPLYTFKDGEISCDWRKGAPIQMTEF